MAKRKPKANDRTRRLISGFLWLGLFAGIVQLLLLKH